MGAIEFIFIGLIIRKEAESIPGVFQAKSRITINE